MSHPLSKSFAVLAILITIMGVFGLASYTAEQKTKEVGIRKVMGAAVSQVISMFVWVFVKIFLIASAIALPAAYFLADYWLRKFCLPFAYQPRGICRQPVGLALADDADREL